MIVRNSYGLLYDTERVWGLIKEENTTVTKIYLRFLILFAAMPPVAAFIGATHVGWGVGVGENHRLTTESAMSASVLAYLAILAGVYFITQMTRWMAKIYGATPSLRDCFALVTYSLSPLFLAGLSAVYPILWLNVLLGMVGFSLSIKLLYTGTSVMMDLNKEQGFILASSILVAGMVTFTGVLVTIVIFWGLGLSPTIAV
ncbi:MAG: Yip1 family protein [Pseudomonadota bacterium]